MLMGVGYAVTKDTSHLYGDEGNCSDRGVIAFLILIEILKYS